MKKYNKKIVSLFLCIVCGILLMGCSGEKKDILTPEAPVTITLWHAYNAYAKEVFDEIVERFNETEGLQKGIIIDTHGYGSSAELDEALYNSANQMIGAEPMPDLFTAYPKSACRVNEVLPLVKLDTYFSEEELKRYRSEFLMEGIWDESDSPMMIPVAKSTELLYLNRTDFDRFASERNISDDMLKTWEGLAEVAGSYYEWSGGQPFMGMNAYNDFAELTAAQLGVTLYEEKDGAMHFNYPEEVARRVWEVCYIPHVRGWYKSSIYNQDGIKSGSSIAYIGSSAGAGYFPKSVIIDGEKSYPIECQVLTYPTFSDGHAYLSQRGADMCIASSDSAHEYAAAEFLKWFTEPKQNIRFAISTGYIPVEKKAISSAEDLLKYAQSGGNQDAVNRSLTAALDGMNQGKFYFSAASKVSYKNDRLFSESIFNKINLDLSEINIRVEKGEAREDVIAEYEGNDNFMAWYQGLLAETVEEIE